MRPYCQAIDVCVCVFEYLRVHGCPGKFGVDVHVAVRVQRGEAQWRREPVLVAELCWAHAMVLLHLWQVRLRAHNQTRHPTVHVMLLQTHRERKSLKKL